MMLCVLLALGIVCSVSAQSASHCTTGNHNIQPLIREGYWKVNLRGDHCRRYFGFSDVCTLYMAYCQPLPASGISGCGATELGQTASLCITNGTVGYSMGAYDDIENPFVLSINQTELVARFGNGSNTDECIRSLETIILFECDPNADWDEVAVAGDVSSYFLEFIIDFEDPCSIFVTLGYDKLCKPVACEAPIDTKTLSSADYWQATSILEQSCRQFFETGSCILYISFCKSLSGIDHCKEFVNSSVCITNGTTDYSLGSYSNLVNPITVISNISSLVAYTNGSNYPGCPSTFPDTIGSIIVLRCTRTAKWIEAGGEGDVSEHLIGFETNPADGCQVLIDLNYSGACLMNETSPGLVNEMSPGEEPHGGSHGVSLGASVWLVMMLTVPLYVLNY